MSMYERDHYQRLQSRNFSTGDEKGLTISWNLKLFKDVSSDMAFAAASYCSTFSISLA